MGKQSARLYYRGRDHVDIICDIGIGKDDHTSASLGNHYKIYSGGKLVWKKELPKYIFSSMTVIHTTDRLKTFSGFHFRDYRGGEYKRKEAFSISFLSGTYFLTTVDGEGIFMSEDGYEWKTFISSNDEKYGTIKKYKNSLYVLTSKGIKKIVKNGGSVLISTVFNYEDVLNGQECLGIPFAYQRARNGFLIGNGHMIVPAWTGRITRPVGSISVPIASTHTLIAFNINTGKAEIVGANLPYNITSYAGGCYHDGYFYCAFFNGENALFGGTPKTLIRRTKDGYAWETYSSLNGSGYNQLFFAGEYLYIISSGPHIRTKDGVTKENGGIDGFYGNVLFVNDRFFFCDVNAKLYSSKDYFDKNSWKEVNTTLTGSPCLCDAACSDESIEIIG